VVKSIIDEENRLLASRTRKPSAAVRQTRLVGLTVLELAFLFAGLLFVLLRGQLRQKENYEKALRDKTRMGNWPPATKNSRRATRRYCRATRNWGAERIPGRAPVAAAGPDQRTGAAGAAPDPRTAKGQRGTASRATRICLSRRIYSPTGVARQPVGKVEYFNGRWDEYTGQILAQALYDGWGRVLHPDDFARTRVVWQEFVYTASHDLRSPIANLEGLLLVLKKRLEHKLLREVSQDIAALISESSVQVVLDMHVETIHYPAKHLRSILYNLLSNALKYRCPSRANR
jgi:hypothetical protein